jgi:hypothetical protein
MGTIMDFEDLEIWKMARELVNLIFIMISEIVAIMVL